MAILPGSMLGMLGGGQLGRMFVSAARAMGYEVMVMDPDENSPAGSKATRHLCAAYEDKQALDEMARHCAVITTEFENIPAASLEYLAESKPVHPSASALRIAQNRVREKSFVQSIGLATSPFLAIQSEQDLQQVESFRFPAILKTATLGYDGKGQAVCQNSGDVSAAYATFKTDCILEQFIELEREVSIVLARSEDGKVACFPVAENVHRNGILDVSSVPANISPQLEQQARENAASIAHGLDYCGVLAVEFFVSRGGELLVNEIAPRPHNSGHYTLDACYTSQFEQQVRMICGLPAGNGDCHSAVAMLNVLGDVWPAGGLPDWESIVAIDSACLHLYGKKEARAGRKMGHINFLGPDLEAANRNLQQARKILKLD